LRIGYVSPDFRDHAVARNLAPLFDNHDHQNFEIFCYANVPRPDFMTDRIRQGADGWRSIVGKTPDEIARQVRDDRIDILVDLALHTANNSLLVFAQKAAPVQVTFAGYPGTTGLTAIDYRLSDPYLDPPHAAHPDADDSVYSEQTIRLPHSFWCYDPLENRTIEVNPLPAVECQVVTFGCLNNFCKVNPSIVSLWAKILREVSKSRLLLLATPGKHVERTLDEFCNQGVDPSRVEFSNRLPRRKYLELYHRIDIGLDSFPYNGHTTSLDSFWMGVPVVTLVGQSPVSRAGWCQLSNLGLTELAATTPDEFVQIAVETASNLSRLKELRAGLRVRMEQSALMNGPLFSRSIEAAYLQMWRRWCQSDSSTRPE
jgi:predicted O-linked N-acetylglucosamine transferase (SPINDLY family)